MHCPNFLREIIMKMKSFKLKSLKFFISYSLYQETQAYLVLVHQNLAPMYCLTVSHYFLIRFIFVKHIRFHSFVSFGVLYTLNQPVKAFIRLGLEV